MGLLDSIKNKVSSAVSKVEETATKAVETAKAVEKATVAIVKDEFSSKPAAPSAPSAPQAPVAKPEPKHWYSGVTDAIAHTEGAIASTVKTSVANVESAVTNAANAVGEAGQAVSNAGHQVIDSGKKLIAAGEKTIDDIDKIAHDAGRVVTDAGHTVVDVGNAVSHAGKAIVTGNPNELDAVKGALARAHADLSDAHAAVTDARVKLADIGAQGHAVGTALDDAKKSIEHARDEVSIAAGAVKDAVGTIVATPRALMSGVEKAISQGGQEVRTAVEQMPGGKDILKGMDGYAAGAKKVFEGVVTGNPFKVAEGIKSEGKGVIDFGHGLVDSPAGQFVKKEVIDQVNGFNVDKQVKELKPGETYEMNLGGNVHIEVGGEAAANLKVQRDADGAYTINAGGNLGVNGYLEAGGRVNLGVVNGSAGGTLGAHGLVGGNLTMKCKTPEEAQRATQILEKIAASTSAVGMVANGGQVISKDDAAFMKAHTTGIDLSGSVAGDAAGALGLDKGIVKAGVGGSLALSGTDTLHIDLDNGKPTGFSIKQTFVGQVEAHGGLGLGLPGKDAPAKGAPKVDVNGKKLPGAARQGAPTMGGLGVGLSGKLTDTMTIETHYDLPKSVSAAEFQKDPLAAIQKGSAEMNKTAVATVTVNVDANANVLGKKNNLAAQLSFTGKPDEVMNKDAIDKAIHGDLEGAAKAAGAKVTVEGRMYTYTKKTWGFEGLGGDVFGVGVSATVSASKKHEDNPPLATFKMNGNEFVVAERKGLENLKRRAELRA